MGSALSNVAEVTLPLQPCATPTLTPPPGSYGSAQSVTLACTTPGSSIFFTIDGSTPTPSSTPYSTPIAVPSTETLRCIATAPVHLSSAIAGGLYTIGALPAVRTLVSGNGNASCPFVGIWETPCVGYTSSVAPGQPNIGSLTPNTALGVAPMCLGFVPQDGAGIFGDGPFNILAVPAAAGTAWFSSINLVRGASSHTYNRVAAHFAVRDDTGEPGLEWNTWLWPVASNTDFAIGLSTTVTFNP